MPTGDRILEQGTNQYYSRASDQSPGTAALYEKLTPTRTCSLVVTDIVIGRLPPLLSSALGREIRTLSYFAQIPSFSTFTLLGTLNL